MLTVPRLNISHLQQPHRTDLRPAGWQIAMTRANWLKVFVGFGVELVILTASPNTALICFMLPLPAQTSPNPT